MRERAGSRALMGFAHARLDRAADSRSSSLPRLLACRSNLFSITPTSHRATLGDQSHPPRRSFILTPLLRCAPRRTSRRGPAPPTRSARSCSPAPHRDVPPPAFPDAERPTAAPVRPPPRGGQRRPRTVDQQRAQVPVAALAHAKQRGSFHRRDGRALTNDLSLPTRPDALMTVHRSARTHGPGSKEDSTNESPASEENHSRQASAATSSSTTCTGASARSRRCSTIPVFGQTVTGSSRSGTSSTADRTRPRRSSDSSTGGSIPPRWAIRRPRKVCTQNYGEASPRPDLHRRRPNSLPWGLRAIFPDREKLPDEDEALGWRWGRHGETLPTIVNGRERDEGEQHERYNNSILDCACGASLVGRGSVGRMFS